MIFDTGGCLRRSREDSVEVMSWLAEAYKRRRKSSGPRSSSGGKPPPKRVGERGSLGRARVLARGRPLAPQPGTGDGAVGSGRPPGGQPSPALAQQEQSPASPASPAHLEPRFLPPRHWGNEFPSVPQPSPIPEGVANTAPPPVFNLLNGLPSDPIPEGTGNAAPPPVLRPQTVTPTGRRPSDKYTGWMDLDFVISGKRQTLHGLYTCLEHHSTVSPGLARLSKHGIQPKPPTAGPGFQAIMRLCIPVCIPNVLRGCREKEVVMEVDEFLGRADFCVGAGVLDKITAIEAGIDPDVGLGPASSSTVDLALAEELYTPAPTLSYSGHRGIIDAHGMYETVHPHESTQPTASPTLCHDSTPFPPPPMKDGEGASVSPGGTYAPTQVYVPDRWAAPYVYASAFHVFGPVYGAGTGEAGEYGFRGEEFDSLAWEPLERCEFAGSSLGTDTLHAPSSSGG